MALAKMVGFEVTPRTPWATRSASRPLTSQSRRRLSSQGLCPAWSYRSCNLVIGPLLLLPSARTALRRGAGRFSSASGRVDPAEAGHQLDAPFGDVLGGEPEAGERLGAGGRGAEGVDAHRLVGVAVPPEGHPGLDGERRDAAGEHRPAVVLGLGLEPFPARERDEAGPHAPGRQEGERVPADVNLAPGRDEDQVRRAAVTARTGTPWRLSTSATGPSLSTARGQITASSLASAGRTTSMPGMARRDASCSIGWWVGPSSPRPTESWVNE